jgi:hypothetical protein
LKLVVRNQVEPFHYFGERGKQNTGFISINRVPVFLGENEFAKGKANEIRSVLAKKSVNKADVARKAGLSEFQLSSYP